jgi:hypothetical protein
MVRPPAVWASKGGEGDLHAAMAIQAVNTPGGDHWLPSPMPQTLRTRVWIRCYEGSLQVSCQSPTRPQVEKRVSYRHSLFGKLPVYPYPGHVWIKCGQEQVCQEMVLKADDYQEWLACEMFVVRVFARET